MISEETLRRKCDQADVLKEAEEILDEMSHTYNLYNVRSFGYAVCKAMEVPGREWDSDKRSVFRNCTMGSM